MNGGACPSSERGLAVLKGWEASLRSRYTVLLRPCFSFCSFSGQVSWSPGGIYPPDWSRVCVYMLLVQISKPCRSSSQPRDPSYSCFIPTLKRWCSKCRTAPGVPPWVLQRTPRHSVWAGARGLLCISCRIGERCGLAAFGEPGGKLTNLHFMCFHILMVGIPVCTAWKERGNWGPRRVNNLPTTHRIQEGREPGKHGRLTGRQTHSLLLALRSISVREA